MREHAARTSGSPEDDFDVEVLARVRAGDVEAFGTLYARDAGEARRFASRLVPAADVSDVVSEAFMRVLAAIRNGAGPRDHHLRYLLVAVRHTAWDRLRRTIPVPVDDVGEVPSGPADEIIDLLVDPRLETAFGDLMPRWRQVLWWTVVEDRSVSEVGERLGISPAAAAALAYRARSALRLAYGRENGSAP